MEIFFELALNQHSNLIFLTENLFLDANATTSYQNVKDIVTGHVKNLRLIEILFPLKNLKNTIQDIESE